jgi:hypothetical protein
MPARCASWASGGEKVQIPVPAPSPVPLFWASSVYEPGFSAVVTEDASGGGHWDSERHEPSLVSTATGGSTTDGAAPRRYWS